MLKIKRTQNLDEAIVYILSKLLNEISKVVPLIIEITRFKRQSTKSNTNIAVQSGKKGWETLLIQELYSSLKLFIPHANVIGLEIDRKKSYIRQTFSSIKNARFSHFVYDPRSGSSNWISGLLQAFSMRIILTKYRITPIVYLTDGSVRLQRIQSIIVSSRDGLIVTLIDPIKLFPLFIHDRVIGPTIMPITLSTINEVGLSTDTKAYFKDFDSIYFTGLLYKSRLELFNKISLLMKKKLPNFRLVIVPKDQNISNKEYLQSLALNKYILTTTFQDTNQTFSLDRGEVNHLVQRVTEAISLGCVLFTTPVTGLNRYFKAGFHYIEFTTEDDLIDKIYHYQNNLEDALTIARQGKIKYGELAAKNVFWNEINDALENKLK